MTASTDGVEVVVVVGTDHHPFDRLVGWVDRWAFERGLGERCLVQFGTSARPPHVRAEAYLQRDELQAMFVGARVIVSHGGPSTIVEALRAGRLPIVVPRDPVLGEHVDAHQQRFAAAMATKGAVRVAGDEATLAEWLDRELADGPAPVSFQLSPAEDAAATLGRLVADITAAGPSRRLRLLRRLADGRR